MRPHLLVQHSIQVYLVEQHTISLTNGSAQRFAFGLTNKNVSLDIRQAHRHSGMLAVWQDFGQGTDHLNLAHSCNGGQ